MSDKQVDADGMLAALDAFIDGIESKSGSLFLDIAADFQSTLELDMDVVFDEYLDGGTPTKDAVKEQAKWDLLALLASARIMRKRLISLDGYLRPHS